MNDYPSPPAFQANRTQFRLGAQRLRSRFACDALEVQQQCRQSGPLHFGAGGSGGFVAAVVHIATALLGAIEFGKATADHPMLPPADHTTSATTATVMNTYDKVMPTSARSRPRSPVSLICDNPKWPRIAPAGANTNANTTDRLASVLVSS